jgi:hypothetical protein
MPPTIQQVCDDDLSERAIGQNVVEMSFQEMLASLEKISACKNPLDINLGLRNFLKKIFYDALVKHGFNPSQIPMELCVAGSLARGQATAYSDIDCLLLFDDSVDPVTRSKIQAIARELFHLADALFEHSHQFCFDPIGISLHQLCGTVDEVAGVIQERQEEALSVSVANARSVFGSGQLLACLRSQLNFSADFYFDKAIHDFPGPVDESHLNLKRDIFRPLDFLILGLAKEFDINLDECDSPQHILQHLEAEGHISSNTKFILEYIREKALRTRTQLHRNANKEYDDVLEGESQYDAVLSLVKLVGMVRGSLAAYLQEAKTASIPFQLNPELFLSSNQSIIADSGRNAQTDIMFSCIKSRLTNCLLANHQEDLANNLIQSLDEKMAETKNAFQQRAVYNLAASLLALVDSLNPDTLELHAEKTRQALTALSLKDTVPLHVQVIQLLEKSHEINYKTINLRLLDLTVKNKNHEVQEAVSKVVKAANEQVGASINTSKAFQEAAKANYATYQYLRAPYSAETEKRYEKAIHATRPSALKNAMVNLKHVLSKLIAKITFWRKPVTHVKTISSETENKISTSENMKALQVAISNQS